MLQVIVSDQAYRILNLLKNWRQKSTLDELILQLAQEEVPLYTSSSLSTGDSITERDDSSNTKTGSQQNPDRLVSDWIMEREAYSSNSYRGKSATLTKFTESDGEYYSLVGGNPEDFFFTKITSVRINSVQVKNLSWVGIIRSMLVAINRLGVTDIRPSYCNWVSGFKTEHGWLYARELNMSIQRHDAYRSCKQIADLALRYKIPVEVKVTWRKKGKYPYCKGKLRVDPRN